MAATYTPTISVFGDRRVSFGTITMTSVTSGAVDTGLSIINAAFLTRASAATTLVMPRHLINVASGGTAANGYLYIGSCTAGDDLYVLAIGA